MVLFELVMVMFMLIFGELDMVYLSGMKFGGFVLVFFEGVCVGF